MSSVSSPPASGERAVARADERPADRMMRRVLRITEVRSTPQIERDAHRGFLISMVVSGIRCLITYLAVPVLVPIVSFAGVVAAPIGIVLCVVAGISGVAGVRRFWMSDHRGKWMYTGFIAFVFLVLAVALVSDIARIAAIV